MQVTKNKYKYAIESRSQENNSEGDHRMTVKIK